MPIVIKIGTSSLISHDEIDEPALANIAKQVAQCRADGIDVLIVASGAMALGIAEFGLRRTDSAAELDAGYQVGQLKLQRAFEDAFAAVGIRTGLSLLNSLDFIDRRQYLHVRDTLKASFALGVVPVVNELTTTPDLAFGGNDRLAALLAHMLDAERLILLTDIPGFFTADPRFDSEASLIDEIVEVDQELERAAGGAGELGTGGMASKLAAAKIAAWSGVPAVIAEAQRENVILDAVNDEPGVGTHIRPRATKLRSRKLWIAFAIGSKGRIVVDDGARNALANNGKSLLPAGVTKVEGDFGADDAVEVCGQDGVVFAKGLVNHSAGRLQQWIGKQTSELPSEMSHLVIHRDDLVVLP